MNDYNAQYEAEEMLGIAYEDSSSLNQNIVLGEDEGSKPSWSRTQQFSQDDEDDFLAVGFLNYIGEYIMD